MKWGPSDWSGVGVLESLEVKLLLDASTLTDRIVTERRPDLVVFLYATKCVCLGSSRGGKGKGEEAQVCGVRGKSGHTVERVEDFGPPLVVGDLASLGGFMEELDKTHLLSKREISFLACSCQFEVLCSTVRIIRRL